MRRASPAAAVEPVFGLLALLVLVLAVTAIAAGGDLVVQRTVTLALINLVIGIALYLFSGTSGVLSFGHLSFVAVGAYTCALLTIPKALKPTLFADMPPVLAWIRDVELGFVPAAVIAGLVAVALAVVTGPALTRLAGLPAGIATLALLVIVYTVLLNWDNVTRGSSTMIGVPRDVGIWDAFVVVALALTAAWAFQRSRWGLRLQASREDAVAAVAVGVRVGRERRRAWVLSAFLAGVGGALFSHFITTFSPAQLYLDATFTILAMVVVGGIGSLSGVVAGVALISFVHEVMRRLQDGELAGAQLPAGSAQVAIAVLVLIVLIKRPQGLLDGREIRLPARLARKLTARAPSPSPPEAAEPPSDTLAESRSA
jgi:branched-chain amino acid transport system permease protein